MLADNFHFVSPYWKSYDKATFLEKFLDPTEYQEKSLSNILCFDPMLKLKSDDHKNFSILFQHLTKYDFSVDEAVLGTIENGLIVKLRSIYDLEKKNKPISSNIFKLREGYCSLGRKNKKMRLT